jgi:hypothetical protein
VRRALRELLFGAVLLAGGVVAAVVLVVALGALLPVQMPG